MDIINNYDIFDRLTILVKLKNLEKELRDELEEVSRLAVVYEDVESRVYDQAIADKIREILGE